MMAIYCSTGRLIPNVVPDIMLSIRNQACPQYPLELYTLPLPWA